MSEPTKSKLFVYQAYGNEDILNQSIFSICSLLRFSKDIPGLQIQIYTDKKEKLENFFRDYPICLIREITSQELKEWRGEIDFLHRVKIEILLDAWKKNKSADLFYCDGDTFFTQSPSLLIQSVNRSTSLMHVFESKLNEYKDPLTKKIFKFIKGKVFELSNSSISIPVSTEMWNAGFIGISNENQKLLQSVLELTDVMYSQYQKHVIEQLAFSYFLQTQGTIKSADDILIHYWDQKHQVQLEINSFLKKCLVAPQAIQEIEKFKIPIKVNQSYVEKFLKKFRG